MGELVGDAREGTRTRALQAWISTYDLNLWNAELAFGKPTFRGSQGSSIIDFFLSRRAQFQDPHMCIRDDLSLSSDHHLCELSFVHVNIPRLPAATAGRRTWKLQRLSDPDVCSLYIQRFTEETGPLLGEIQQTQVDDPSSRPAVIEDFARRLNEAIYKALDDSVTRSQSRPKSWKWFWTAELQQLADRRQLLYQRWRRCGPNLERINACRLYSEACARLSQAVRAARRHSWRQFCTKMQGADPTELISVFKRMRANRRSNVTLSSPDGPLDSANRMIAHLGTVFGGPDTLRTSPRVTSYHRGPPPFTLESVRIAIRHSPNRKAPGIDHIRAEMLKPIEQVLGRILYGLFSLCWAWSWTPVQWRTAQVVPIYKQKGSAEDPASYRPISLTSVFRKLLERCLVPELLRTMPQLDIAQGEFRASRGTLDQALCLHELMAQYRSRAQHLTVVFLDIKAAYDSVDRTVIWDSLKNFVPQPLLALLEHMFDDVSVSVILQNVASRSLSPRHGVLQGSILSPFLYSVYIDSLPRFLRSISYRPQFVRIPSFPNSRSFNLSARNPLSYQFASPSTTAGTLLADLQTPHPVWDIRTGRDPSGTKAAWAPVNCLLYADDVAIVGDAADVLRLLAGAEAHSHILGYRWSPSKCEVLSTDTSERFSLYGQELPRCTTVPIPRYSVRCWRDGLRHVAQEIRYESRERHAIATSVGRQHVCVWSGCSSAHVHHLYPTRARVWLSHFTSHKGASQNTAEISGPVPETMYGKTSPRETSHCHRCLPCSTAPHEHPSPHPTDQICGACPLPPWRLHVEVYASAAARSDQPNRLEQTPR